MFTYTSLRYDDEWKKERSKENENLKVAAIKNGASLTVRA